MTISSPATREVAITLQDAYSLHRVAVDFGQEEAPDSVRTAGSFERLTIVDYASNKYFGNKALGVLDAACNSDPFLDGLVTEADRLARALADRSNWAPPLVSLDHEDQEGLAEITGYVQRRLASKALEVVVRGTWIDVATTIANYALRVIGEEPEEGALPATRKLYEDSLKSHPINRSDYWQGLLDRLEATQHS